MVNMFITKINKQAKNEKEIGSCRIATFSWPANSYSLFFLLMFTVTFSNEVRNKCYPDLLRVQVSTRILSSFPTCAGQKGREREGQNINKQTTLLMCTS